jgi:hypothetical protein
VQGIVTIQRNDFEKIILPGIGLSVNVKSATRSFGQAFSIALRGGRVVSVDNETGDFAHI